MTLIHREVFLIKDRITQCRGGISESKLEMLRKGVDIGDDKMTLPAQAELIQQDADSYKIYLTITEGRFHQVKRMIQAVDGEVTYLKRISMGPLTLDENLPKGAYRQLTKEEIQQLYMERK